MFKKFITLVSIFLCTAIVTSGCSPSNRHVYHQQPVYVQNQPQHVYETRRPFFSFSRHYNRPIKRTIFKTKKVYVNKTVVVNKYYSKKKKRNKRR